MLRSFWTYSRFLGRQRHVWGEGGGRRPRRRPSGAGSPRLSNSVDLAETPLVGEFGHQLVPLWRSLMIRCTRLARPVASCGSNAECAPNIQTNRDRLCATQRWCTTPFEGFASQGAFGRSEHSALAQLQSQVDGRVSLNRFSGDSIFSDCYWVGGRPKLWKQNPGSQLDDWPHARYQRALPRSHNLFPPS